jgi:integrase
MSGERLSSLIAMKSMLSWVPGSAVAILLVALHTRLRASELIGLRCCDIVFGTGAHIRCEGKGRKHRATPLRRETVKVLVTWLKERKGTDTDPLFPSARGTWLSRDALEDMCAATFSPHRGRVRCWPANGSARTSCATAPRWNSYIMASTRPSSGLARARECRDHASL